MIIYFSATGNCEYVANKLTNNEQVFSIVDSIKENKYEFEDEKIGIISPTYFWGLPTIVVDFLKNAKFSANYLYFVSTYGTSSGKSGVIANKILNNKINAIFNVKMPDTWTPIFDLSTNEKVNKFTSSTNTDIKFIAEKINNNINGDFVKSKIPMIAVDAWQKWYKKNRQTDNLNVNNSCIGCGICSKNCPSNAIGLINKKPIWIKDECTMCLSCLHHCPKFAINFKNKTQNHSQYIISNYYN